MSHRWWFAVDVGIDRPVRGARERVAVTGLTSRRCLRRTRRIRATSEACGWFARMNRKATNPTMHNGRWSGSVY